MSELHAALAAGVLVMACSGCPGRGSPPDATAAAPARVIVQAAGGEVPVRVEVARTPAQLEHGLMDRSALPADAGMIFVFEESARHGFWMKNTLIPLDMLFIGEDGRIAAIVERRPLSLETTDGGVESRYVLEVNGGWTRTHGVKVGDRVRLENVLY